MFSQTVRRDLFNSSRQTWIKNTLRSADTSSAMKTTFSFAFFLYFNSVTRVICNGFAINQGKRFMEARFRQIRRE